MVVDLGKSDVVVGLGKSDRGVIEVGYLRRENG